MAALARLHVRVSTRTTRCGDHFLLMTSLGVWDFRVNALISHRRGRNHALMLGWWRGLLSLIGSGRVLALRNSLLTRILCTGTRSGRGPLRTKAECQKDQPYPHRCNRAEPQHWVSPKRLLLLKETEPAKSRSFKSRGFVIPLDDVRPAKPRKRCPLRAQFLT